MRKLSVFLTLLCLGLFISCSSDSDDSITPDEVATPPPPRQPVDRSANLLAAGASANDILSNNDFTSLRIEIAYVTGFRPTQETMNEFEDFLRRRTFKEDIEFVFTELPSPNDDSLTIQEIADNRTVYNSGNTLGIYIYFADAPSDGDEEDEGLVTLGAVFRNTTMVIHEATIRRLASFSSLISVTDIETATINHEFGHLFGLVNLGTPAINDHEDVDAPNHCNVPGCLMLAELQFGGPSSSFTANNELKSSCSLSGQSVMKMLQSTARVGNAVPLDPECILDIQSNGGR